MTARISSRSAGSSGAIRAAMPRGSSRQGSLCKVLIDMTKTCFGFSVTRAEAAETAHYVAHMTKTERYVSLGSVIVPFAAFVLAIVLLWQRAVDGTDLTVLL